MIKIVNVGKKLVVFNTETEDVKAIPCNVRGVDDVFIVPEDAKLHWENSFNDTVEDVDVKKGDIIVTFYDKQLGTDHAIVKSEDWIKAITHYNDEEQKLKEKWAAEKAQLTPCCNDCCECPCCNKL